MMQDWNPNSGMERGIKETRRQLQFEIAEAERYLSYHRLLLQLGQDERWKAFARRLMEDERGLLEALLTPKMDSEERGYVRGQIAMLRQILRAPITTDENVKFMLQIETIGLPQMRRKLEDFENL